MTHNTYMYNCKHYGKNFDNIVYKRHGILNYNLPYISPCIVPHRLPYNLLYKSKNNYYCKKCMAYLFGMFTHELD